VTNYAHTTQRIESVRSYAGKTITVLGWARRSSGSGNTVLEIEQNFGTTGSPSSAVRATSTTTTTLTSSYAPFAIVIDIPSITGKTLGTDNNDYLSLNFWTSAGSNFNARTNSLGLQDIAVDFWGIHVKVGTHTTDAVNLYKQPELGPELVRCQRYYEVGDYSDAAGVSNASITGSVSTTVKFYVTKRAVPTITGTNVQGTFSAFPTVNRVSVGRSDVVANRANTGTFTADAEL